MSRLKGPHVVTVSRGAVCSSLATIYPHRVDAIAACFGLQSDEAVTAVEVRSLAADRATHRFVRDAGQPGELCGRAVRS